MAEGTDMEMLTLFTVGDSAQLAAQLRDLLSNSGINVRIKSSDAIHNEADQAERHQFSLVIFKPVADRDVNLGSLVRLTQKRGFPIAIAQSDLLEEHTLSQLRKATLWVVDTDQDIAVTDLFERIQNAISSEKIEDTGNHWRDLFEQISEDVNEPIAIIHEGCHAYANSSFLDLFAVDDFESLETFSIVDLIKSDEIDIRKLFKSTEQNALPDSSVSVNCTTTTNYTFPADMLVSRVVYNHESCLKIQLKKSAGVSPDCDGFERVDVDPLSRCMTRQAFLPRLTNALANEQENGSCKTLLFLEPDFYSECESTLGYAAADQLLAAFSTAVQESVAGKGMLCHFTDAGFLLFLSHPNEQENRTISNDLLAHCARESVTIGDRIFSLQCNAGRLTLHPSVGGIDEAVNQVRLAQQEARREGNVIVSFRSPLSPVEDDNAMASAWEERFALALNNGSFFSVQQSIVNLEGEPSDLMDNMSFLREPEGDVAYEVFSIEAESCQLGAEIDRALISSNLDAMLADPGDHRQIININSDSLLDESFSNWLVDNMSQRKLSPSRLILQVRTESVVARLPKTKLVLNALAASGFGISLSGFENDPRHFRVLNGLPVSCIRPAQHLFTNLGDGAGRSEDLADLVKSCEKTEANVIAEGVQAARHLAMLWQLGIKLVAGDFLHEESRVVGQ